MERAPVSESAAVCPTERNTGIGAGVAVSAALALACGFALRAWMYWKFPQSNGDALIYGDLAKNLLLHGQFASSVTGGGLHTTLIRLPGYPFFLAACFRLFGIDNYGVVGWLQICLDLGGCLLLCDFVRGIANERAAQCTLWLSALCPFTAVYAGAALTEAPTLFVIALALWSLARFRSKPAWAAAMAFTFAVTFAALLRPDGALVGVTLAPALLAGFRKTSSSAAIPRDRMLRMTAACVVLAMLPFAAWTVRNWRAFHVIEPLAPRYATDPGEDTMPGFQRWMKTWCLDFVSTYNVYWHVAGEPVDMKDLPARAFDSRTQYDETAALFRAYEENGEDISPEIDAGFARLAQERIAARPLRYYAWLPLGRLADMWLRPRVENLPIDLDWWVYTHHYAETRFSWFYAGVNAFYVLLGGIGLCMRPKYWPWILAYFLLRSALLATIESPEARYTLECFPMLFAFGGIALQRTTVWARLSLMTKTSDGRD